MGWEYRWRRRRKRSVIRCRRDGDSGNFRSIDPCPVVMTAIDLDVGDVFGHNTLVVPKGCNPEIECSAREALRVELVVQSFRRGKDERTVFGDGQGVTQDILKDKSVVCQGAITMRNACQAKDCSANAVGHGGTGDRDAGDIAS